jgi:GAF domain-containing protein
MNTANSEQSQVDRFAMIYRLAQTFNSSLDLDEVLNHVMDEVIAAIQAERGFIMLEESDGKLVFKVARSSGEGGSRGSLHLNQRRTDRREDQHAYKRSEPWAALDPMCPP